MTDKSETRKSPEPMDKSATEQATPSAIVTRPRDAYALTTLISEVQAIWPDIEVQTYEPNGRSVNRSVAFYDDNEPDLRAVLEVCEDTERVEEVDRQPSDEDDPGYTYVTVVNNPALYDIRDTFDIAGIVEVMSEDLPKGEALIDPDDEPINDGVEVSDERDPESVSVEDDEDEDDDVEDVTEDAEEVGPEPEPEPEYIYRSAKTGRIVTENYAKRNPDTTVRERVDG